VDPRAVGVPKASPDPLPELAEVLAPVVPRFHRRQSRARLERYVTGLLPDLPRKTRATMAAAVAGPSTEPRHHLLPDAAWDPVALDDVRGRRLVAATPADGGLVLADTGRPTQGRPSVGVARQYAGTLGTIGHCQVVVSAEYVAGLDDSRARPGPVSAQGYLPEAWASDPQRRPRAHIPAGVSFQTTPDLALALIDRARAWEVPFAVVVADAGSGAPRTSSPALRRGGSPPAARWTAPAGCACPPRCRRQLRPGRPRP
jgi:SRSO17 transposase